MPEQIYQFLDSQRVGVVAVQMPDGSPHGATVHFAYQKDPFTFVFLTNRKYRKMEPLLASASTPASFVVGTDEITMKTLQLDGIAELPKDNVPQKTYFEKFPEKEAKFNSADDMFFVFTPTWWRYTDYKAPEGMRVLTI